MSTVDRNAAMQAFFDAVEGGDGAALFQCCTNDSQLFDTDGNVFLDMATLGSAEATAEEFAAKMGPVQLLYTSISRDTEAGVEIHDVSVFPEGGKGKVQPAVTVRVKVTLELDAEGKVRKSTEEEINA